MPDYIGRFAPSPTGLLHLGSLIGALASFLDAKANSGYWLLRIEDLDPPREMPGAAEAIIDSLRAHALQWDGEIVWQSRRIQAYTNVIDELLAQDNAYYCTCSRADLRATQGIYRGRCRGQTKAPEQEYAIRAKLPDVSVTFEDIVQGHYCQHLLNELGDVIVQRKDGLCAYQLAVVIDDVFQGVTHVVRGSDLLDSTAWQIGLQQLLGLPTPRYAHIPVVTDQQGQKLSKQSFAAALCNRDTTKNLITALQFLQQSTPPAHLCHNAQSIVDWAAQHWQLQQVPKCHAIAL